MKAVIYRQPGSPAVLEYIEVPDPVPGEGEILIKVEAISIEGGELASRRLRAPGTSPGILGNAAAGEVIGLGQGVEGFTLGQKVATFGFSGSYAELRAVSAATSWVIPSGLDIIIAAAIPCGPGTAAMALELARVKAGDTVLVQGATGGVGNAAVQLAARAGAYVLGSGTDSATLEQLRPFGLSLALPAASGPVADQVRAALGGGADVLIDMVGGAALEGGLQALNEGGRAVIVGITGGGDDRIDGALLLTRRLTVSGCFLGAVIGEPKTHRMIQSVFDLASSGELKVPIDEVFPLPQAAAAHARAEQRGRIGRVIMTP